MAPFFPFNPGMAAFAAGADDHREDITSSRVWCPVDKIWADQKYVSVDDMFECSNCRKVLQ